MPTAKRQFSIRTLLIVSISMLTLLLMGLALWGVHSQWQKLEKIRSLKEIIILGDLLFDATEKLAIERDVGLTMLHTPDAESAKSLHLRLQDNRRETDDAFILAVESLKSYPFEELTRLREAIGAHLPAILALRTELDRAATQPKSARDRTLSMRWYDETAAINNQAQDSWNDFIRHFTSIDPMVTQHLRYRYLLRMITKHMGQERAIIGRLLVENADPSPQDFATLLRAQGTVDLAWKMSRLLAEQSGLYKNIAPYYTDAQSHYSTVYDMVQEMFYQFRTDPDAAYPLSADLWLELSTQAADSLNTLKEVSRKEIRRYVDDLENSGERAITLHMGLLLAAVILCVSSFWIITRRVIRPIHLMVEALLDTSLGKPVALKPVGTGRRDEIGKLAQVLHAFQESGERYRALTEASSQIIWTWKPGETGEMAALYEWWERTTGQPGSEMLPFGWLKVVHPEDREHAEAVWSGASTKGHNFEMEYRVLARDGKYRHLYVRGVALRHVDGTVREFVGALNDVTFRKEAEENLKRYMNDLERSNKELDDFAYIASHDLKEPLRGIHNHSRFLLEDNKDKLDPDSTSRLGRLVYLSQRMEHLVNDLLYFSRLGRQEMAIQPADLNEAVKDIETMMETLLHERGASVVVPKPLPTIVCDKTRITEALRNLITNAIKYNDKKEKTVEIGWLTSHPLKNGQTAHNVVYVRDNGLGIAPEFHDEIFRIFKRLQSSKGKEEEGTGVGLTFVKKIIERHGGKIWLDSEPGRGTTFYFTLEGQSHDQQQAA